MDPLMRNRSMEPSRRDPAAAFRVIASNPAGFPLAAIPVAASRAGAIGILDATFCGRAERVVPALRQLARSGRGELGVRLSCRRGEPVAELLAAMPAELSWILVDGWDADELETHLPEMRRRATHLVAEVVSATEAEAARRLGFDALVAKGGEAGGRTGEETAFVLCQRLAEEASLPVWVRGGIGSHSAAACMVAGAAGVCLDWQLALTREAAGLPEPLRGAAARSDGSESICLGGDLGEPYRLYHRQGWRGSEEVAARAEEIAVELARGATDPHRAREAWRAEVRCTVSLAEGAWAIGQEIAFAAPLAELHVTVGGIVQAIVADAARSVESAREHRPLAEGSGMARSHGTRFPVVQGPMTRVSDGAGFARAVSDGGGLPFLALALLRRDAVRSLLEETRDRLGDRPWGVGILGFVPLELRTEQLEEVGRCRPDFALIAGGRPDQAAALERQGVPTYLHVPSPALLRLFLADGARRFVFEGRECGGHVGPRTSFVLWNTMVDVLLESVPQTEASACHVLFAGGIHDARSAAMVAALAAPLAARGMRVGVLMGTAYLLTREAVETGAIVEGFQQEALGCAETVLLETGPGHATRCSRGPFADRFRSEKERLRAEGRTPDEIREALERLNLGRLRVAAKGIDRAPGDGRSDGARYLPVEPGRQREEGLYMIGQVAALERRVRTIEDLHREVSEGAMEALGHARSRPPVERRSRPAPAEVAIVGIGTLLPGAPDLRRFWHNVLAKVDAVGEVPPERWDPDLYYTPERGTRDRVDSRWGGFLSDVPFDPLYWGLPPAALGSIEPVQLLTLELVRQAMEDAGYLERAFPRETTSVLLGAGGGVADLGNAYAVRSALPSLFEEVPEEVLDRLPEWTEDSFAGILLNVAAGRVANRFDLGGVNCTLDAACASSLAAVYMACQELEAGSSDLVIAGGVDTVQNPFGYLCFSKTHALSPNGRCRTFDAAADGIAISEGLVALVLKRVADAERDGDRIYAVIQGVAASSDGRAKGLTAPRPEGQARALRRAYAKAGFSPATVGLVEAHGTGTVAGDRAEVETLTSVFGAAGAAEGSCALGSVKSMIGHTKCAAGAAGLAKVALSLHHRVLPPTLHVERPGVPVDDGPFYLATELRPWIAGDPERPRRAGVSAFGFGGTNFHVAVEEYRDDVPGVEREAIADSWPAELLLFRAPAEELAAEIGRVAEALERGARPTLAELAWTTARRAGRADAAGARTLAVVARDLEELRGTLDRARRALEAGEAPDGGPDVCWSRAPLAAEGSLAFLYPGQGSQYPGMLRELAVYLPPVREAFEEADVALGGCWDRPLSAHVFPPPAFDPDAGARHRRELTRTDVAQPALGAAAVGLHRLLARLGIAPDRVAGHSYGEYVALWAAGAIDDGALPRLSYERGRAILDAATGGLGGMIAVGASRDEVEPLVEELDEVWVANENAPRQVILSGTDRGIERALERLGERSLPARRLPVGCAFHSPVVSPARDRLEGVLAELSPRAPRLPVYANSTGAPYPSDPEAIRELLSDHLVRPVRFREEIETMYSDGARIFVEVGPKSVLTRLVGSILGDRAHAAVATEEAEGQGLVGLLRLVGRLAAEGVPVAAEELFHGRRLRRLELDRLVEETRERGLPASTWLVSGGAVRRAGEPIERPAPYRRPEVEDPAAEAPSPAAAGATPPAAAEPSGAPLQLAGAPSPGDRTDAAGTGATVLRYQRFLETVVRANEDVVMAYFGGAARAASGAVVEAGGQLQAAPFDRPVPVGEPGMAPAGLAPAAATGNGSSPGSRGQADAAPAERASAPETPDPEASGNGTGNGGNGAPDPWSLLLEVISERTGYPPEILSEDRSLEADLGIDSIKRVEILGALRGKLPDGGRAGIEGAMERLGTAGSLGSMAAILREAVGGSAAAGDREDTDAAEAPPAAEASPAAEAADEPETAGPVPRFRLEARECPAAGTLPPPAGPCLLVDDGSGVAEAVAAGLRERGATAVVAGGAGDLDDARAVAELIRRLRGEHGRIACLVHLAALGSPTGSDPLSTEAASAAAGAVRSLYLLARELEGDLADGAGGRLLAVTGLGGGFGFDGGAAVPAQGAVAGLVKTLALEWPTTVCRSLDLDPADDPAALAAAVLAELESGGDEVEVARLGGRRFAPRPVHAPLGAAAAAPRLDSDSVVLVTGGARGITAAAALELARRHRPVLVLAGRSEPPSEAEEADTAGVDDMAAVKRTLIERMTARGEEVRPAAVEAAYRRLLAEREIRRNLEAMRAEGARVEYLRLDVRDGEAVGAAVAELRRRHGRLDGIVHGAGLIEDKLIRDKEPDSWDRVYGTKVDGALALARAVEEGPGADGLRFFLLFASVAGTFGNRGQGDYAAANEALARLAAALDRRWPATRAAALAWGPWGQTGMASDEVQRRFEERGVQVIPPAAGARAFADELAAGSAGEPIVLLGDGPWAEVAGEDGGAEGPLCRGAAVEHQGGRLQMVRRLDPESDLFLADHLLDGRPVLPAAVAMELMAETAARGWPDLVVTGLRDFRVQKGVVVDDPVTVHVSARAPEHPTDGGHLPVTAEIRVRDGGEPAAYRAVVELGPRLPEAPAFEPPEWSALEPCPLEVPEIYDRFLFHGPLFAAVERVRGAGVPGIVAELRPSDPARCIAGGAGRWLIDPIVVDGSFQLAILWSRLQHDLTPLPSRFARYRRFGALDGGPVTCYLEATAENDGHTLRTRHSFVSPDGRLLGLLEGMESTCSRALNRLARGPASARRAS